MKLSKKQQEDIESIQYFINPIFSNVKISEEDIVMFIENSEKGLHKDKIGGIPYKIDGFNALIDGKQWRGVHMKMYEEGVLEGTMPYFELLGGDKETIRRKWYQFWKPKYSFKNKLIPRSVVNFMKKEMFKGQDAETIEKVYQSLL